MRGKPGPTGDFPHGALNERDEGGLNIGFAVDPDKQVLVVQFGTPVKWIGLDAATARAFVAKMTAHTEELERIVAQHFDGATRA